MDSILGIENLKAVILETYGAGNAPSEEWFMKRIRRAVKRELFFWMSHNAAGEVLNSVATIQVRHSSKQELSAAMTLPLRLLQQN